MNQSKLPIDYNNLFKEFFYLKDWKQRSLGIGSIYLLIALLLFIVYGLFIFTALGELGVIILFFFLVLLMIAAALMLFQLYLAGYRLDLINIMKVNGDVETVPYLYNFGNRIYNGFKLSMSLWAYGLIPMLITITGSIINTTSGIFNDTNNNFLEGPSVLITLLAYLIMGVGSLLQFVVKLFLHPLLTARFIRNNGAILDSINISEVWNELQANWKNFLIVGALIFLNQTIVTFILSTSAFTVFLCIGILLFPVVIVVSTVYTQHFQARAISSLLVQSEDKVLKNTQS